MVVFIRLNKNVTVMTNFLQSVLSFFFFLFYLIIIIIIIIIIQSLSQNLDAYVSVHRLPRIASLLSLNAFSRLLGFDGMDRKK